MAFKPTPKTGGFKPGGSVKNPSSNRFSKPSGGGANFTKGNDHKSGYPVMNKPGKGA